MSIIVVTGPSRSGKSEWAEQIALQSGRNVTYVATAVIDPKDPEWQNRIRLHQARRPKDWQTVHVSHELATFLLTFNHHEGQKNCLLVDSLGTWLANLIEESDDQWNQRINRLLQVVRTTPALVVFVAEETGWGIVPSYPTGRTFRDRLGYLTRKITAIADEAYVVCAGIAINLKEIGKPVPSLDISS